MDLEPYADNPIIDELLWLEQSGHQIERITPVLDPPFSTQVAYSYESFSHLVRLDPGSFREHWTDAAEVLRGHSTIHALSPLSPDTSSQLAPAEARLDAFREQHRRESEARRFTVAEAGAAEAFRQRNHESVVSLLSEFEPILSGSTLRKLLYSRRKLAEGAA